MKVNLTLNKIDLNQFMDLVRSETNGAYVTFDGVVRNHSKGQDITHLEFEAYEPMALKEMNKLVQDAIIEVFDGAGQEGESL